MTSTFTTTIANRAPDREDDDLRVVVEYESFAPDRMQGEPKTYRIVEVTDAKSGHLIPQCDWEGDSDDLLAKCEADDDAGREAALEMRASQKTE